MCIIVHTEGMTFQVTFVLCVIRENLSFLITNEMKCKTEMNPPNTVVSARKVELFTTIISCFSELYVMLQI